MKSRVAAVLVLATLMSTLLPSFTYADVFCSVGDGIIRASTPLVDIKLVDEDSVTTTKLTPNQKLGVFIGVITGGIVGTALLPTIPFFGAVMGGLVGGSLVSWLSRSKRQNATTSIDAAGVKVDIATPATEIKASTNLSVGEAYQRVITAEGREAYLQAMDEYRAAMELQRQYLEAALK